MGGGRGYDCMHLAGSERAKKTGAVGKRFKEAVVDVSVCMRMSACESECAGV